LVVVTNQSGVARGYFDEQAVQDMHRHLSQLLRNKGVEIEAFYYCPHHPQGTIPAYAVNCACRKPQLGLLLQAQRDLELDLSASWMVGDIMDDVAAGQRAGCRTILLTDKVEKGTAAGFPAALPTAIASDLLEAAKLILHEAREANGTGS
jgi:histidinol-phosphate phosphatase family protein